MGLFSRNKNPLPPYDSLTSGQRYSLYFLLDYLTSTVPLHEMSWALQYLEKAAKYLGISKKQIEEFKPYYNTYDKIVSYIKTINNRQILEYMISNCSNIFILMNGSDEHRKMGEQAYKLYGELGFPYSEVRSIVHKYQYRTEF